MDLLSFAEFIGAPELHLVSNFAHLAANVHVIGRELTNFRQDLLRSLKVITSRKPARGFWTEEQHAEEKQDTRNELDS